MANENKTAIATAIWDNPELAFGCRFRKLRDKWVNVKGGEFDKATKLALFFHPDTGNGANITVRRFGGTDVSTDVFTYLGDYVLNTRDFKETLQRLAELYGVSLQFSVEERQAMTRAALAREVTASLVDYLRRHPDGVTGRYLRDVRGVEADGTHFGELTKESIAAAKDSLRNRGITYDNDDFKALGLTDYNAERGFNCVIPYYVNGAVRGFVLRNTNADCSPADRYHYSQALGRGGYCDALNYGDPAVIVEGQFDAIRLIQAGVKNVIAIGGAKIGDDIARLLHSHGITQVTYVPDLEHDGDGKKITKTIADAIKAFQSVQVDGTPVITSLYVAELPTPDDFLTNDKYRIYKNGKVEKYKWDADSYGKEHGGEALAAVLHDSTAAWAWELDELCGRVIRQLQEGKQVQFSKIQEQFSDVYSRVGSPFERQRVQNYIFGEEFGEQYRKILEESGITPQALKDFDALQRNTEGNNRLKDGTAALNKAIQEGGSPERIKAIIQELNDAVALDTRDEWEAQLSATFADELQAIEEQPDTLKTKWEIGAVDKQGTFHKHDNIEFYPADIEVFCAPTSHGKTMILFQSAMDLIADTNKTYLYVSCEENKRQLLERALNVYIDIPTTEKGTYKDDRGNVGYCFKEQTRKKTIKAVIRNDAAPFEYVEQGGSSSHYVALSEQIKQWIKRYERVVFPRLKMIHTEASIESICSNITRTVEEYRAKGIDVGGVFVDYMQLLTTDARNYSRHDELKDICKALKDCAARTELPIIIAAQLNREVLKGGIDTITVANIGEGADIERIAHDIYLVWQVDKTHEYLYNQTDADGNVSVNSKNLNVRSNRIYSRGGLGRGERELKTGYLYVERMKARDGKTEGWGMFPYDGERGYIGKNDVSKMTD